MALLPGKRQVLRVGVPLSGVGCPECGHETATLTVDLPYEMDMPDAPEPSVEEGKATFTLNLRRDDPIPVMIACAGCERSVKWEKDPPTLEVAVSEFAAPA